MCDWFSRLLTGNATADRGLLRGGRAQPEVQPLTSGKNGSWAHATGSHVIWKEKPLTRWEKWIAGSGNRKSRDLEGETADQLEKWIAGARWSKTAGETRA